MLNDLIQIYKIQKIQFKSLNNKIQQIYFKTYPKNLDSHKMSIVQHQDLNKMVSDYLKANGMQKVADMMQTQINNKYLSKKFKAFTKGVEKPRLLQLKEANFEMSKRELNIRKDIKQNTKKYKQIINASKNVFQVTINLVQLLQSLKQSSKPQITQMIQTYKIQLTKYYKVVQHQGKPQGQQPTQVVFYQHKNKLDRFVSQKNIDGICQVLLSFRVNALQIAPQLRKNLVYELIRNDLFKIQENQGFQFVYMLLDNNNPKLRYAIIPLISIVCSTLRGVEYMIYKRNMGVMQMIIKIMLDEKNGSVIQRFCLALLQKCSVKETVIPVFLEFDLINWLMRLIKESLTKKIHHFSLDFGSALLANIIHAQSTLTTLSQDPQYAQHLMQSMLRLLKQKTILVSILMHLLICLSYLSKQQYFKQQKQNSNFVQRISDFVQYYSQISTSQNQAAQIDKRTVLDLCAHMFHPRDVDLDNSQSMEYNQLKTQDRIREYENQQGELIFQCFQDQV